MKLTRDKIQRMINASGFGGSSSGGGGGGASLAGYATQKWVKSLKWWGATFSDENPDPDNVIGALTGVTDLTASGTITGETLAATTAMTLGGKPVATQEWVGLNYVSIAFFGRLFQAYNGNTAVNPNDLTTTIDSIKAMFGFWTDQYLTALGKNPSGSPSSLYLSQLADVSIPSPTNGQVLTYNTSTGKWVAATPASGIDLVAMWNALATNDATHKIDNSHLKLDTFFTEFLNITLGIDANKTQITIGGVTKKLEIAYATKAGDSDKLGGTSLSGLFTDFSNITTGADANKTQITIGGTTKKLEIAYATKAGDADKLGGTSLSGLFTDFSNITTGTDANKTQITIGGTTKKLEIAYAAEAGRLSGNSSYTVWGQTYWSAGTPNNVTGDLFLNGSNLRLLDYGGNADCYICAYGTTSRKIGVAVEGTSLFEFNDEEFYSAVGIYAASYVTALSDIRYKNVIRKFALDAETVAKASIIQYRWKDHHDDSIHVGGIAQEWEKILPEAVHEAKDGKLSMDYGVIAYTAAVSLAKKVVEQQKEIDELKHRLDRLEKLLS